MSPIIRTTLGFLLLFNLACGPSDPLEDIREMQSAGKFSESINPLRGYLDKNPSQQTEASFMLGKALLKTGSGGLAVWPLRKASESPDYAVEAGMLLTEAMIESRTAPDAVKAIDRVLAIEPENLEALVLRVDANRAAGNVEDSLADIDRVLEIDPSNLPVLVTRVTALIRLERIEEAGAALDAAQASFDKSAEPVVNPMLARLCVARALFTMQAGDRETAERYYAGCAERFPAEKVAVTEIVTFYDRIGRPERATEVLRRAASESDSGLFWTLLARRLGALGRKSEEEKLLRVEAEKRNTDLAWFILADHYVQRDLYEEAIQAFERAVLVNPGDSRLRFAYADTLVQAEHFDRAREVSKQLQQKELRSLIRGRILLGEGNAGGRSRDPTLAEQCRGPLSSRPGRRARRRLPARDLPLSRVVSHEPRLQRSRRHAGRTLRRPGLARRRAADCQPLHQGTHARSRGVSPHGAPRTRYRSTEDRHRRIGTSGQDAWAGSDCRRRRGIVHDRGRPGGVRHPVHRGLQSRPDQPGKRHRVPHLDRGTGSARRARKSHRTC